MSELHADTIQHVWHTHKMSHPDFVRHWLTMHGQSDDIPGEDVDEANPVLARVEYGRWLGDCLLGCAGAEMLDPENHRFFCLSCKNRATNGRYRAVIFPDDKDDIERILLQRPEDQRHWRPGETLAE